ncbi:integrase [Catenuloplanes nepalensis]|uniref:Integrase n=1 Tax=Catenuloplanes nepalensis TaxID=587533 RepID=A0ABT9MNF7_9ACTN|nr:site-specific integrase [Catenuloplanes nepalensis]MDP9792925.1 integrase [Catenuloplanes nepalensis]
MTSHAAEVEAARLLLTRLGVTPEQLLTSTTPPTAQIPTFTTYIRQVAESVSPGTRRIYSTYWKRIEDVWGDRRLDEPTALEIRQLAERTKAAAVTRSNARGGRSAAEHLISATRCLYRYAVADGIIAEADNPATRVPKPRRLASTRRALPHSGLAEIIEIAGSTGNDPELDSLVLRFHLETACRRGGALALRRTDLDPQQCLVLLREKGGTVRWQPVSPTLMAQLLAHHEQRGGDPKAQLLRYRNGNPITSRRYDHFWSRIGRHLPWVRSQQVSTHWLRYTTLTWVERHFGYAVARAYAGHEGKNDAGVTYTYVRAALEEVARALAALTGEAHPLSTDGRPSGLPPIAAR